jgi:hypothetical protein
MTDREIEENDPENEWCEIDDWFFADFVHGGRLEGKEVPTHWMPLPEPPK